MTMDIPAPDFTERIAGLSPSKRELLELTLKKKGQGLPKEQRIRRRANDSSAPLSFAQQRLWFLEQLDPDSYLYNIPRAFRLSGALNVEAMRLTLDAIVTRHESLRTTFATKNGTPIQVIAPRSVLALPVIDLSKLPEQQREAEVEHLVTEEAHRPFDLGRGPLIRTSLLKLSDREHVLMLMMHHIVSDAWSAGVFFQELTALYEAFLMEKSSPLPELPIQYADYAVWQREWLTGAVLEQQLEYWKKQLAGAPAVLELPTDRPRATVQSFRGQIQPLVLSKSLTGKLKELSQREGVTLFMTLLSAFKVLLSRYSGQEDIVVGSPIANRTRVETEGLIGFFINTLVLRSDLSADPTFREMLARVRETTLGAYEHQDMPFEKLVEELQPERSLSRNPLFQVMLLLHNEPRQTLELPGLMLRPQDFHFGISKFDLILFLSEEADGLRGGLEYSTDLFDASTITRMLGHFQVLLETIVANPEQRLSELTLLTEAERHQLLVEWQDTQTAYPKDQCIHELFEAQVEQTPDPIAVVFEEEQLSYLELNGRANQVANYLRKRGVGPEVLVGIAMERSVEMVVGMLGILKAGGAYVPLDPMYPQERLRFMLEDTKASVLLTHNKLVETLPQSEAELVCLDTDWEVIARECAENLESVGTTAENLAYVIYTSGSTGKPKGVAIEHRSAAALLHWARNVFAPEELAGVLASTSICFDLSVFELFVPLSWGGKVILAENALDIPTLAAAQKVTLINTVPSAIAEVLRNGGVPASVSTVNLAGERLQTALVRQLYEQGTIRRVYDLYGPSEDTTYSTFALRSGNGPATIGRPIANTQVYLLDRYMHPVPVGVAGELHIGGDGLARGYLNRPKLTAERFIPNPFSDVPTARLYKTGDLARYLPTGDIEYLGRIDHQVKIRGFRIELGEIEATLAQHPGVRECVVLAREDTPGEKRLVGYLVAAPESAAGLRVRELRSYVKEKLPEYMVPSAFVMLTEMPLTPNGKIDRRALPAPDQARPELAASYVAPRSAAEEVVAGIWSEVLGVERVGIYDNFFELGGHSLLATQVISRIREVLQVELPLQMLFESPVVAEVAERVEEARRAEEGLQAPPIVHLSRESNPPLSFAQERLWFLNQMEPDSSFYNMPLAVRMNGALDVEALRQTINSIVARHESLRTTFRMVNASPVQVIAEAAVVTLPVSDLSMFPESESEPEMQRLAAEEAQRPFDLARGPALRAKLLRLAAENHVLLLTMHHIVSDGWSGGVLFKELAVLYEAFAQGEPSPLPELPIQYADYAVWQKEWLKGEVLETQLAYWRNHLGGDLPVLELPTDHPRPAVQSYQGALESLAFSKKVSKSLKALSRHEGATLFMTMLAAFQTLLHRYTSQQDILVGSAIANRNRAEIEGLIGFFVNTLVLRTDLSGNPSFRELISRVREMALGAYAHQDLPFEKLVEELHPERDLSRNPLFQVMFAFQNAPLQALELHGLTLHSVEIGHTTAKFDLALFMWEEADELHGAVEYSTDLFDASTIQRLLGHFQVLLEAVVANPDQRLSDLTLLTEAERHQILVDWNQTQTQYPRDKTIVQLFEAQVERTPDVVAVVFENEQLSYAELNRQANQVGHYLRKRGVGPETHVGVSLERSTEMVVGIIGILKAGGAYVPLDASYPRERLSFMLEDARVPVLLTQQRLVESFPEHNAEVLCLDTDWDKIARESTEQVESEASAENVAYVIYTSGSTGRPKGVAVMHRSVIRLVKETNFASFSADEVFLQFAPISFDASTLELWGSLLNGARLVVFPAHTPSLEELSAILRRERVSTLWLTAGLFHQMVDDHLEGLRDVRQLLAGGDVLSVPHVEKVLRELPECLLINGYGPTENTTFTCCYGMSRGTQIEGSVPIGRPISNTRVFVLDKWMQPVPVGVAGELYIGGDGLARGYLNRAELTAERFVSDPFSREAGARLYRTGDRVRYLQDGVIEFFGRLDQQVKIRGYRIELEEIETVLSQHAAVEQAVVLAREDTPGDKRLVAYVTQKAAPEATSEATKASELQAEQIAQWQVLYNETYGDGTRSPESLDPTFNITGWNSSYTGEAIPATEMREWVEHTVERILSVKPRYVLEIGCGTGLLLWRVAPGCEYYLGTDFSQVVLDDLVEKVETAGLKQVKLWQREATDFTDIAPASFDAVVINSVAQYFPSIDYLVRVLEGAVQTVRAGGTIFIGDVRNYELLEAFHASVELHRATAMHTTEQLRQRVQSQITEENELVIAPGFFVALKEHLPQINAVEVMPKRGRAANELTKYRYDVILHVGEAGPRVEVPWLEWQEQGLSIPKLRQMLEENSAEVVGLTRVPNARVAADAQIIGLMANQETLQTVEELREAVGRRRGQGVNPEEFWELGQQCSHSVDVSWARCGADGRFDVVFRRRARLEEEESGEERRVLWPGTERVLLRQWSYYANQPLARTLFRSLVPKLRSYLQERLPEYMVPAAFVLLEEMPLTPNGKIDRRALPAPDRTRPEMEEEYVAPRNAVEEVVCGIWAEVLDVEEVGVCDDFFVLGGHSLKATQVISRVREAFQIELPLRSFFEQSTVAGLAAMILEDPNQRLRVGKIAELLVSLAGLSQDEVDTMLDGKSLLLEG